MNPVFAAALRLQRLFEEQQWRFCFIGGIAVQRWGEPRHTEDADATLLTGFGDEDRFLDVLLRHYEPRVSQPREFARRNRVLLLRDPDGVEVDIAMGAIAFEADSIQRATRWALPDGQHLLTCSAEDLVVHKCFASRELDWSDVKGVLTRHWGGLDLDLIRRELRPLAEVKEDPETIDRLERLISRLARSRYFSSGGRPPWETTPP